MNNVERLEVIEGATHLLRGDLARGAGGASQQDPDKRLRAAALSVRDLYETGEFTEWTSLDGEEVVDDGADHR